MITMYASVANEAVTKPVMCKKCRKGRLADIPVTNRAIVSKRGKPPPSEAGERLQVKCLVCGTYWTLII